MTISRKAVLSFLISILLCGAFAVLAYTGLFDLLETRFYIPTITASITRDNGKTAEAVDRFLYEKQAFFSTPLQEAAVRRSFLSSSGPEDILARERIFRILAESYEGIQWVRFIDSGGVRIQFSTYAPDIQHQAGRLQAYLNYNEPYLPYDMIAVRDGEPPKYIFDAGAARILFSFPFYDLYNSYLGTALFSLSVNALSNQLINEGRLRFGHDITVISNPAGLLFGITAAGESALPVQISYIWKEEGEKTTRFYSSLSRQHLVLLSTKTSQGFFIGRLASEELFSLPQAMHFVLLITVFTTVFLIIFLIFNFRQDPVVVVQNRLKHLQISLVDQFYELKSEADWSRWMRDLDVRRNEIIVQVKRGINFDSNTKSREIDALINKSWDELLAVLGGRKEEGIDEEKLLSVLKRVLADLTKTQLPVAAKAQPASNNAVPAARPSLLTKATAIVKELEETEEVEELDELDEAGEIEELGALEGITAGEPAFKEEQRTTFSGADIASLASKIEFSPDPEPDSAEDDSIKEDLEIVSPFAGMVFDFSAGEDSEENKAEVIAEQEGVPYISEETLNPAQKTDLNPEFKNLVDSVISPKP